MSETEFRNYLTMVLQAFGYPQEPAEVPRFLLMSKAALTPILELGRDAATLEWLAPGIVDAVERARDAIDEAQGLLEQIIDDVGIPENAFDPAALADNAPMRGLPRR